MITILGKDPAGDQFHPAAIYDVKFSLVSGVGCEKAEILLPFSKDLPDQLDEIRIYDNLDLLWIGRVEDKPEETTTGEILITAVGYASHLKDELVQKLWMDTGYANWSVDASVPWPEAHNADRYERDNNNRTFARLKNGDSVISGDFGSVYYSLGNKIGQAIYTVSCNYEIGSDAAGNQRFYIVSYSSDLSGESLGALIDSGPSTGSATKTINPNTALAMRYHSATTKTATNNNNFLKTTSVRVNGSSNTTGVTYADDLVKEILGDFAPSMSTDYTSISTGGTEITTFYAEDPTTPLELIDMATGAEDWKTGIFGVGSDDKPQWEGNLFDRSVIDWTVNQDEGELDLAGKSIQEVYNSVVVEYLSPSGEVLTLTRTATVTLLDDAGITREAVIRVQTESVSTAQASGDAFLAEFGRSRAKGQMTLHGDVLSKTGIKPAWYIKPNDIIHIQDLEPDPDSLADITSDPVTNGQNIFEIVGVEVDVSSRAVVIQLETPASRLDYELVT